MPLADITRLEPTIKATGVIVHTCAVVNPARSISLTITAPQRVLVPQVEVKMTAVTPSAWSRLAILCPIFLLLSKVVPTPTVL